MEVNLDKIIQSGQCFRPKKLENGKYLFVSANHKIEIENINEITGDKFWENYFDLDRDYDEIESKMIEQGGFLKECAKTASGIRVLNQDPWEALVSFIISQRNNIPRIKNCVEKICESIGSDGFFPSPEKLCKTDLTGFGLGYRKEYVELAAQKVSSGEFSFENMPESKDEALRKLMDLKGVGTKVANCVALYSLKQSDCFPVDVWIQRILDKHFNGVWDHFLFSGYNGIVQLYMFFTVLKTGSV